MKSNSSAAPLIPTDTHQKTIALMQITRIGDVIQTLQAAKAVKKFHGDHRVILICREQFGKALQFVLKETFDEVYFVPTNHYKNLAESYSLQEVLNSFNGFLAQLNAKESISALINLSYSKTSNYLAAVIKADFKIGPHMDHSNSMRINDKWSTYLYSHVLTGAHNPYSLVDLFKNIIGVQSHKPQIDTHGNVKKLRQKQIVIHPFASQERKMWRPEKWVEIIYKTLRDHKDYSVILVGSKQESLRSQLISENPLLKTVSDRLINKVGKTNLEEVYETLNSSQLFVGHDSMVGHLASLVEIPTLTISLGSVRPTETTPYHENAYNLAPKTKCFPCFPNEKCDFTQCHMDVPHQTVSVAINQLLKSGKITQQSFKDENSSFHLGSVHLYASSFNNFGQQVLTDLIEASSDSREIFRNLNRVCFSFLFSQFEENIPFPRLTNSSHQDLYNTLLGIQHLYELCEFGMKYSRYILEDISSPTPSMVKIKEFSKKIDEVDQLQALVKKTHPLLSPIIDYMALRKANLFGENVVQLTESSYYVYEEAHSSMKILYELVEKTIVEHKSTQSKITNP